MRLRLRHIILPIATVIALYGIWACDVINDTIPTHAETSLINIGDQAPAFSIESTDGEQLSIGTNNDSVTLLILFSHTCPDCKNLFDKLQATMDSGVELPPTIAVSRGGTNEDISTYKQENGYTIAMAADIDKTIYFKYATMYVPRCYLIDKDGIVRHMTIEHAEGDVARILETYNNLI